MPTLYVVSPTPCSGFQVFDRHLREIETGVFDSFKIQNLAPYSAKPWVANYWHLRSRKHTAFSWHDAEAHENTIFIPGLLSYTNMFAVARDEFKDQGIIPSATYFRLTNYDGAYFYD